MPDLFANTRIKEPDTFFEYKKVQAPGKREITEHYARFIEPVYDDEQNTVEKFWSYSVKNYEITEDKKAELVQHNI
jgi:hypothetical protein